MNQYLQAYHDHRDAAKFAQSILLSWYSWKVPRVPGMDTVIRLARRIALGKSAQEAAASEYVYRWHLAIKPGDQVISVGTRNPCASIFGAPHTIGLDGELG
jgi:hypothetical protein